MAPSKLIFVHEVVRSPIYFNWVPEMAIASVVVAPQTVNSSLHCGVNMGVAVLLHVSLPDLT